MDDIVVRPDLRIPAWELEESVSRGGGPGGQHVNKTSTRVQLRWPLADSVALPEALRDRLLRRLASRLTREGVLVVAVDEHRSQHRNRLEARERMAGIIREALVVRRPRRPTRPTRSANRKRLKAKKARGAIKEARSRPAEDET